MSDRPPRRAIRALVTGGAGFIGSAIAKALVDRGDEVIVLDNLVSGSRDAVPDEAEFVEGDIRDPTILERVVRGMDVVFHEAAIRSVPRSIDEPMLVHECNVTGTLNTLMACERAGVRRLVYASSSSAYGGTDVGPSREDMHPRPRSPYAASKLSAEYYCTVWSELNKLSTVSLRYFNVFGPGQSRESRYAAVFPALIDALLRGEQPMIHGDGHQSRDFTYVDDVVQANLLASDADLPSGGLVMNTSSGEPRTVNEVLQTIQEVLGTDIPPVFGPPRAGDVRHSEGSNALATSLLGWHPRADWRGSVEDTVAWFAEVSKT